MSRTIRTLLAVRLLALGSQAAAHVERCVRNAAELIQAWREAAASSPEPLVSKLAGFTTDAVIDNNGSAAAPWLPNSLPARRASAGSQYA